VGATASLPQAGLCGLAWLGAVSRDEIPRQQLFDAVNRVLGDLRQHVT
jgi:hypothetical protein